MKKIYYNKLIRDRIPEKIKAKGGEFKTVRLNARQFEQELLRKAGEEAAELLGATAKDDLALELADVLAVVEEIKRVKRISNRDITKALKENMARKGGFKKKLFLIWSSDDGYKAKERRGEGK